MAPNWDGGGGGAGGCHRVPEAVVNSGCGHNPGGVREGTHRTEAVEHEKLPVPSDEGDIDVGSHAHLQTKAWRKE